MKPNNVRKEKKVPPHSMTLTRDGRDGWREDGG